MKEQQNLDFQQYYDLESYLFNTVRHRFAVKGYLNAFDFFCIVIWKAERAKSKIAKKLLKHGNNLDTVVRSLTTGLGQKETAKEKLRFLWESWGFYLPTATAILTVLYPDDFTVYDARVCDELNGFHDLKNISNFENLWHRYEEFKCKVKESAPLELTLRDKDRYLWGKSFCKQLNDDIKQNFSSSQQV